jgi:hypothetical protein
MGIGRRVRRAALLYLPWLGSAALVAWLGWPALWVEPGQALGSVLHEVTANGAQPHHTGNYFLGQPVADPGWLFYPAVVLWRTTPPTLLGLLLVPLVLLHSRRTGADPEQAPARATERHTLLVLLGVVLLFGLAMSMLPKKFDRYLLPIWPLLEIAAAIGLMQLVPLPAAHPTGRLRMLRQRVCRPVPLVLLVTTILLGSNLWYHPYYLAYFNPLVGGGATAQRVLLVGWGEGMEQVGAWLRTRPDLTRSQVLAGGPRTLEPFVPVPVDYLNEHNLQQPASYAVVYVRQAQRQESATAQAYLQQEQPLYTLSMYGIEYARVYQPPRPVAQQVGALFGDGLHLRGFSQHREDQTLVITPSWSIEHDQPGGLFSFVHVLDEQNRRVSQVDAPIDEGMFATWQAGQQFATPLPIHLPASPTTTTYRVVLGVYNPANGARLPLVRGTALAPEIDGAGVIELTTLPIGMTKEE